MWGEIPRQGDMPQTDAFPTPSPGGGGAEPSPEETEGDRGRAGQVLGEPEGRTREAGADGEEGLGRTFAGMRRGRAGAGGREEEEQEEEEGKAAPPCAFSK